MLFIPTKEMFDKLPEEKALLAECLHGELVTPLMMVEAGTTLVPIEIPDGEVTVGIVDFDDYRVLAFLVDGKPFRRYVDFHTVCEGVIGHV